MPRELNRGRLDLESQSCSIRMKSLNDIDLGQFIDMTAITTNCEDT